MTGSSFVRLSIVRAVVAAILAALQPEAAAHAQEVTGTIYGTVSADDGSLLPGATIVIRSPQLIRGEEVLVTNDVGVYRVPTLPPGLYSVKAEMSGFAIVTREGLRLEAGQALPVNFRMQISALEETLTVVGESPLVDVRSSQAQKVVDSALIENIPTGRGFADLLTLSAGVVDTGYEFAPAQSVQGSSPRDNAYSVDGAAANDTTVGYMFMDVPYEMLDQVQVTSGGISAEFGQASGAVFNFITKSGGNDFQGGATFFYQNEGMQGSNVDDVLRTQGVGTGSRVIQDVEHGYFLGGPIMRDRVWFFSNIRWILKEQTQPDFPAFNPTADDRQAFAKVTSQLTRRTNIQASLTDRKQDRNPSNASFRTVNSPDTWTDRSDFRKIYFLGVNQTLSGTTFVDARFSRSYGPSETRFASDAVGYQDLVTGLLTGGRTGIYQNVIERDNRSVKFALSHFQSQLLGGSHDLRVGGEQEVSPLSVEYTHPTGAVQLLWSDAPYRVRLYNTPAATLGAITRWVAYAQDKWTINRFTINAGVRFESSEGWLPEQGGGGNPWFPVTTFPEKRDVIKWFTAVPRLGVVWDVRGNARTSLRASYGRYANALFNQHVAYTNPNGSGYLEYDWTDNGDRVFQAGEQGTLRRNIQQNLNFADPNLKQPYLDAVHVGLDQQLSEDIAVSIAGIYKRERDLIETRDVGIPFSAYDPINVVNPIDGQPITVYALNRAFQGVQARRMLTNPNDPVRLERNYVGLELALRKRMSNRWQLSSSLNLGRSEGTIGNSFGSSVGSTSLYASPNSLINVEGPLDMDAPVQVKVQGTFVAPHDISLSATYSGISGFPVITEVGFPTDRSGSYTVRFTQADHPAIVAEPFVEIAGNPRGMHRFDFRNLLAVRAEKRFRTARWGIGLIVDAFNLFNINSTTAVQSMQWGHPNFLKPSRITPPRAVKVGMRVTF